jgi:hypothetical protein
MKLWTKNLKHELATGINTEDRNGRAYPGVKVQGDPSDI